MWVDFMFFSDTTPSEIYTLSLHDALPISGNSGTGSRAPVASSHSDEGPGRIRMPCRDRKSTRLNSSHANISYAVFCLKKKLFTRDLRFFLASFSLHLPFSTLPLSSHYVIT